MHVRFVVVLVSHVVQIVLIGWCEIGEECEEFGLEDRRRDGRKPLRNAHRTLAVSGSQGKGGIRKILGCALSL